MAAHFTANGGSPPGANRDAHGSAGQIELHLRRLDARERVTRMSLVVALVLFAATLFGAALLTSRRGADTLAGFLLVTMGVLVWQQFAEARTRAALLARLPLAIADEVREALFDRQVGIDPVTGLVNRRFAELRLASEIARARRRGLPLLVLTIDVEDYLAITSAHGPKAGEEVLKAFAVRLQQASRGYDLAARAGGENFLLVLPECRLGQAFRVLERMSPVEVEVDGRRWSVSFSIGWAHYQPGETVEEFLERAARELKANKREDAPRTIVSFLEGVASNS